MTSTASIFNPTKTKVGSAPIRFAVYDNCFREAEYRKMCEVFDAILSRGLSVVATDSREKFTRRLNPGERSFYDAYIYANPRALPYPFTYFASWSLLNFLNQEFAIRVTSDLMFALHHHEIGSQDGYKHSDYNATNFARDPLLNGINLWNGATTYQGKQDPRPFIKRPGRSLALLYYFNNPEWAEGDGGETAFFETKNPEALPYEKIAPLNNRLLAFEVSPHSFHAFLSNVKSVRNCLAFWCHSEVDDLIQRFGMRPIEPIG